MTGSAVPRPGRPSASSVSTFLLSLATAATAVLVAVLQSPLDLAVLARIADSGWGGVLLLPDQMRLTLVSHLAVALSLAMTFPSLLAVFASRRAPDRIRAAAAPVDGPRRWVA